MFDRVVIVVRAGDGGAGAVSFRREKFVPLGGPDGGDGGDGGDVVIKADSAVTSLRSFRGRRFYQASSGGKGQGNKKHGAKGEDLVLVVPIGTVVSCRTTAGSNAIVADLEQSGQRVQVARGGKGGWGNIHFVTSTSQAPQIAQKGEAGEENDIILEMRLIADVGIIGYPNVGKSTLLAAASAAKPKIANYPFTTIEPVLGTVKIDQKSFVMAEIPGLIEDAHLGRGLGHDFLRHVIRTKILIHLVDASSASPVEDWTQVNTELGLFDSSLLQKPQLIAVNKVDLLEGQDRLIMMKKAFSGLGGKIFFLSAATGRGVSELMAGAMKMLDEVAAEKEVAAIPRKLFRPQPKAEGVSVHKEGDSFVIVVPGLERIVAKRGVTGFELRAQLNRQLTRLGVKRALEKAGARPGDKIRCGNLEWQW